MGIVGIAAVVGRSDEWSREFWCFVMEGEGYGFGYPESGYGEVGRETGRGERVSWWITGREVSRLRLL